jgi:aspartyl-tRNA(Asn)/glutamyl-tRNA(Gln) amidotransferase subunit C
MDVKHVAKLANLPLSDEDLKKLEPGLNSVLDLVSDIQKLDTSGVDPTSQVTGQVNVTRDDVVDQARVLTQAEALSNATDSHNGFFRVKAIF